MITGAEANAAVEFQITWITSQRLNDPTHLERILFAFPRVKLMWSESWQPASPLIAAATGIMRDPGSRREHVREPKTLGIGHPIPSRIVYLSGVTDVEYKVSKHNMERLLNVGCLVIQMVKGRAHVRIPFNSPAYHGQPRQYEVVTTSEPL